MDACERLGLDTDSFMAEAGLCRDEVCDPDGRLPREKATALWQLAFQRSPDPNLALHAAEQLDFGAYKVVDYLAAHAPSLGAAYERIARYFAIIDDWVVLEIGLEGSTATYGMTAPELPGPLPPQAVEYTLAAIFLRTRAGLALEYPLERVDFAFPRPADIEEHQRIFGCDLWFDQPVSQLVLSRTIWDQPIEASDGALFSVLEEHARLLSERVPPTAGLVGRVREAIATELTGGDPSLGHVARRLALGERTLQRRLRDAGAVFGDLLDGERERAAKAYLVEPGVSLAEAAFLLGFSDQSAFTRAFRRWTGRTPRQWRASGALSH
jgi:AraC-like DNA-binding protein